MTITVTHANLTAGVASKITFTPTWTGATISNVTVVLTDTNEPNRPIIEITTPAPMTNNGSGVWKAILPATETSKLLRTPADANSALAYTSVYGVFQVVGTDADGDTLTLSLVGTPFSVGRAVLATN